MTKVVLTKEVTADGGADLELQGLTLRVRYDYARASEGVRRLDVRVSDELGPRILLGAEDQNGRRDGLGEFARAFPGRRTVALEAPLAHGAWAFDRWEVSGPGGGGGAAVLATAAIEIDLAGDVTARAHYRPAAGPVEEDGFRRGDTSGDGRINLTDAVQVLEHLFLGGSVPTCRDAADADDSGKLEITDAVRILGYLFIGLPAPPAPGPDACGADPTADTLGACAGQSCP